MGAEARERAWIIRGCPGEVKAPACRRQLRLSLCPGPPRLLRAEPSPEEPTGETFMDRKLFITLSTFTGLLVILYLLFRILDPFLLALGWAAALAA